MRDPVAIAKALRDIAGGVSTVVSATLGTNMLPATPAVEVWLDTGDIQRVRAAQAQQWLERHTFLVAFFVVLTENLEVDEEGLGTVVTEFINVLEDPSFDITLGGLAEQSTPAGYEFQIIERRGYQFRAAVVTVLAGEL